MQTESKSGHAIPFGWHMPSQRMLSAHEVKKGRACDCVCAACGTRLQARQGSIRIWHFAHDEETNCQHASETAIHKMAKQLIVERGVVYVPALSRSRTIHGQRRVWSEVIAVDVQLAGLQHLSNCSQEKTIWSSNSSQENRRPDVYALLDGLPLAVEIKNTHAVDYDKQAWLGEQGCSVLEINIADIVMLSPDAIPGALESRLFQSSNHSEWLTHAGEENAKALLDQLETQVREARSEEERALLAKLEAEEAAKKRIEDLRRQHRDVEDFKIGIGGSTIRLGRNHQRASLTIYGHASDEVFKRLANLANRHQGSYYKPSRCWEFYRYAETKPFYVQLKKELQEACLGTSSSSQRPPHPQGSAFANYKTEKPLPIYFNDLALQEAFDERAAILEFDAGLPREEAENLALAAVSLKANKGVE